MVAQFGYGQYESLELSGKFAVGHRKFYTEKYGNPVNVFYPIDHTGRKYASTDYRLQMDYKNQEANLVAEMANFSWLFHNKKVPGTFFG